MRKYLKIIWLGSLAGLALTKAIYGQEAEKKSALPSAECPAIVVTVSEYERPKPLILKAQVPNFAAPLTYHWSVSAGTILRGQGGPEIAVDTDSLEGRSLTVAVDVGGLPPQCPTQKSVSTEIPHLCQLPFMLDAFAPLPHNYGDDKARLDNFAAYLMRDSARQGFIIAYSSCDKNGLARAARQKFYLVEQRGLDANRIVIKNGGCRDRMYFELYILPNGALFDESAQACPPCRQPKLPAKKKRTAETRKTQRKLNN